MIFLALILGLVLRLISLNQSLWLDEATSGLVARNYSFIEIVTKFAPGDFHPPFYYLILKGWSIFFGTSEIGLRSLSLLAGLGTIYFVYLLGKVFKIEKPYITSFLLATSGLSVYYSQEARMYSLASFFVTATLYFFVKIVKSEAGRIGEWVIFGLLLTASILTHYLTVFMVPVYWLYAKVGGKGQIWWKRFVTSHIILAFFAVLWSPIFLKQFFGGLSVDSTSPAWWNILGKTSIKEFILVPTKFLLGRVSFENNLVYALILIAVFTIFGYLFFKATKKLDKRHILWGFLILPLIFVAVVGVKLPVFSYFRLLFILPAVYLITAIGISQTKNKAFWTILVLSINLASSFYYLFTPRFHRENWRDLVDKVEREKETRKSITLFVADSQMEAYRYYAANAVVSGPSGLNNGYEQIWLMRYVQPIFDSEDKLKEDVENLGYMKEEEFDFNGVVVWKYTK